MAPPEHAIRQACALLREAQALLICAGAGMGVDSGLPDFRGTSGFWRAYPALRQAGIDFHEIASPASFATDPALAWGFYGHRLALYRSTVPHAGFGILRALGERMRHGSFVFTSNVDGQFGQAGFDPERIVECHGSIHYLQCSLPCGEAIWPATEIQPDVDLAACRLRSPLPRCPRCGALARPNILMFNDGAWVATRTEDQYARLAAWRAAVTGLVVVELGAGVDIPSVRRMSESQGVPILRINPRASELGRHPGVAIACSALDTLETIRQLIQSKPNR